ncbi:hypothetical protein MMC30_004608 [Trapelia coarctata]|nr:hypothetical protein [Trapelia coarctata]
MPFNRNLIYDLCLEFTYALSLTNTNTLAPNEYSQNRVRYDWRSTPSLLLVNQQIHNEALESLYRQNFTVNSGCTPSVILGSFSITFLQMIRHVTLNINLDSDWENLNWDPRYGETHYVTGWWLDIITMLSIVWDPSHNLQTLKVNFTAAKDHYEGWNDVVAGFGNVSYLHLLLTPLKDIRGISRVSMSEDIVTLSSEARTTILALLNVYTELTKCRNGSETGSLCDQLLPLPSWRTRCLAAGKRGLLSKEFIRWWSLAEEGFRFDKKELVSPIPLWPNHEELERAWKESSWKCLPFFPLRTASNAIERGRKKFSEDEWGTRLYFAEYDEKVALKEWET